MSTFGTDIIISYILSLRFLVSLFLLLLLLLVIGFLGKTGTDAFTTLLKFENCLRCCGKGFFFLVVFLGLTGSGDCLAVRVTGREAIAVEGRELTFDGRYGIFAGLVERFLDTLLFELFLEVIFLEGSSSLFLSSSSTFGTGYDTVRLWPFFCGICSGD